MGKIDEVRVSGVEPIVQHNSSVCWFASFQMLYHWKERPRSDVEKKIRERQTENQKKADPPIADFDYMSVHGIGSQDLLPCGRALNLEWGGGEGDIKITPLLYVLDTCGPIWIAGKWNSANHVIVLTGAKRAKVPLVYFLNPWLQFDGGKEVKHPLSWLNEGRGSWRTTLGSIMHCGRYRTRDFTDYED